MKKAVNVIKRYVFRFKNDYFRFQLSDFKRLSEEYVLSEWVFALHYIYCTYRYGNDLSEYLVFEFYKLKHLERKTYITRFNKYSLYRLYNSESEREKLVTDKVLFNKSYKSFIQRDWLYTADETTESITAFIKKHNHVIAKPTDRNGGTGIVKLVYKEIENSQILAEDLQKNNMLLEEVLVQHEKLNEINSDSLNTIRPLCLKDKSGNIQIVSATLRVGKPGSVVDNFSSGGVMYPIDVETGIIYTYGANDQGEVFIRHPYSGRMMVGEQLPHWDKLISEIKEAMNIVPELRLIAWDVALLSDRIEIVEGNLMPGTRLIQADKIGKKPILKKFA